MKRTFIPENFKADDKAQVTEYYQKLLREDIPQSANSLRDWILRWNELSTVLSEASARRYVAMTSHTQDEKIAKAYMDFVQEIDPICEDYENKLERKMMAHPNVADLDSEFGIYFRDVRTSLSLFNPKNIPLFTEESTDIQDYQKITSTMSVQYKGETKTLPQMSALFTSTDRNVREEAWKLVTNRRLEDKERLDAAFDKLFRLRIEMAKNSGFSDYLDYIFKAKSRLTTPPRTAEHSTKASRKSSFPT